MLTPDIARDRAQDIVARARKAGADAADASLAASASIEVAVRLGQLEDVGRSEDEELSLRVFVGRRSASVSSSDLSSEAMDMLVERAVAMAREAPEDQWAGLAPEERLLHGATPDLDLADRDDPSPAALKEAALAAEDAARAVAGVTNSEGGGASASRIAVALATSHGFAGAYQATSRAIQASVLAGQGGAMQRDYAYHAARHARHLDAPEAIGSTAGERAVARVDPIQPASGPMPVIFDPRIGSSMVGHLIGAISGAAIARQTRFLLGRLGERVFAAGITLCDDPHRPHGLRSRPFDGEGLAVSPTAIVSDGMLETWLLDSASARQLGLEPTGHAVRGGGGSPSVGTSNSYIAAGSDSREALFEGVTRGVYVTELIGMGVNGVTGDYSRGAAGFLIENGELTRPIQEFTIAGNLTEMFAQMTAANDLEFRYAINVPTLRIDGMTVAGG
jgi:PmbA protein